MRDDPHYFKNFCMRRTLRIFPPYYAFFLICLVCAAFSRGYVFSWCLWAAFAIYGTSLVATQSWFPGAISRLPNPAVAIEVTWSLSIEELFYPLWAPAVRFLQKRHLGMLLFAIIFLAPAIRYWVHSPGERTEYFFFPARIDTLAFGALLALYRERIRFSTSLGWLFCFGMVCSASMLFLIDDPERNVWFAVSGYSVLALTMALGLAYVLDRAGGTNTACRVLRSSALVKLGTISYMFYLLHLFVIRGIRGVFSNVLMTHWVLNRVVQLGVSFALTYALAALSWKHFESPILRLKSRFASKPADNILHAPALPELPARASGGPF